ncbi:helix-turn-helix transcriptional regulator [Mycoplasmatota bacterium zrk1]
MIEERKIGITIQELRKKNKMSQGDLADIMHISRQAISRWERNEALPDIYNLQQLSKIFNTSIDDILSNTVNRIDAISQDDQNTNSSSYRLLYASKIINIIFVGLSSILLLLHYIDSIVWSIHGIFNRTYHKTTSFENYLTVLFILLVIFILIEKWIIDNLEKAVNLDELKVTTMILGIMKFILLAPLAFLIVDRAATDIVPLGILVSIIFFMEGIINIVSSIKIGVKAKEVQKTLFKNLSRIEKVISITSKLLIFLLIIYTALQLLFPIRPITYHINESSDFDIILDGLTELQHSPIPVIEPYFELKFSEDFSTLTITNLQEPAFSVNYMPTNWTVCSTYDGECAFQFNEFMAKKLVSGNFQISIKDSSSSKPIDLIKEPLTDQYFKRKFFLVRVECQKLTRGEFTICTY